MNRGRVEALFWAGLLSFLMAGIGVEVDWGRRWTLSITNHEPVSPEFASPPLSEPYKLPPADAFLEIAMRPLFVVTRRPAPVAVVEPPKPRMKRDQFVLTGTLIVAEGKFAYLSEKASKKSHVVAEGKEINGILVKEVSSSRVVLNQHDETETIVLVTAKAPPIAPPPAGTPPAGPQPANNPPSVASPHPSGNQPDPSSSNTESQQTSAASAAPVPRRKSTGFGPRAD